MFNCPVNGYRISLRKPARPRLIHPRPHMDEAAFLVMLSLGWERTGRWEDGIEVAGPWVSRLSTSHRMLIKVYPREMAKGRNISFSHRLAEAYDPVLRKSMTSSVFVAAAIRSRVLRLKPS